ncbi:MAG TPA: ROK family transcriptional regulator, partial [Aestuariivirga sp.]|nr:ROK family transcriptional regulator [Aestuariivirga sp.]
EAIRQHGPIARADIAGRVGLTVQTVSNIIRELEEQNYIAGVRDAPKSRGYPATSLSINPDGGYAIGINITPLGLEAALINLAGEVVARKQRKLSHPSPETAFREIFALVEEFRNAKPGQRMLGIGLAMPGPFDVESMSFVGPTTLEGWKGVRVQQRLAEGANLPAFIEVDHAAAALGERLYGAGRDFRDFYYLYFGVGLGGCMVQDGLPLRGSFRNAGEIGHLPLVPDGEPCPCGNRGCLERYLSLEAYERRTKQIGVEGWIAETVPLFRSAIVTIENLFDPETIIIGGLTNESLLARLVAAAQPLNNSISKRENRMAPRLMHSMVGNDAVLRGAAALAVAGVLSPRFGIQFTQESAGAPRDPMLKRVEAA